VRQVNGEHRVEVPDIMGNTDPNAALNLGLLLDEHLPVAGVDPTPPKHLEQLRLVQRVSRLVDTMRGAQDNDQMLRHAKEICRLPVKGYGTTEFDMSETKMAALIDTGFSITMDHLRNRGLA